MSLGIEEPCLASIQSERGRTTYSSARRHRLQGMGHDEVTAQRAPRMVVQGKLGN